jgi:hypothetical protein
MKQLIITHDGNGAINKDSYAIGDLDEEELSGFENIVCVIPAGRFPTEVLQQLAELKGMRLTNAF